MARFLIVLLVPLAAEAGDLTLFAGFQNPGELSLNPTTVPSQVVAAFREPGKSAVFGVRLNSSNAPIGFEHTLAFSPNLVERRTEGFIYSSNLLVQAPFLPVCPYGTFGIGLIHASGEGPASFGTKFGFNYGGGVKFPIAGALGGRVDLRGYSVRGIENQSLNILETSFGLVLGF